MQAMILAAGMGKRLRHLTKNNTKCMVKVNGETLIERALRQLDKLELNRIVIVVGYEGKKLIDYIGTLDIVTDVVFVENPIYDKTNNIYSLSLAKDWLIKDDTILLESDLIFEDSVLTELIQDPRETLALVDKYESWMDGTCIKIGENDSIDEFIPGKKFVFSDIPNYYKTVNIYKFSVHFSKTHYVPFLDAYSKALGNNEYYEQVLRVITMLDDPEIEAKKLCGQLWYEIDDIQDLDIASSMFAPDDEAMLKAVESRYGGYWRYPKLLDFCYLVNPYYPPKKLVEEMKASFEKLLTEYPSGMGVNSLLAAKNFGIDQGQVAVGNGAAELINALMQNLSGKVGFIRPTFEEYPNRYNSSESVIFTPENDEFSYNADDLIGFFGKNRVDNLILINPDNPTGNYIPKADVQRLVSWCKKQSILLVIDESFLDFSDEENATLLDTDYLDANPHLIVVKSISKSYGVPGIRLGILASGDRDRISLIKKAVSIWNINSYGEFYMQIAEKYAKDYKKALKKLQNARKNLVSGLEKIPALRVIPSQANYVMAEILSPVSARELARILLSKYSIFIKDLSSKIKKDGRQFIRLAVRDCKDNARLIKALTEILK